MGRARAARYLGRLLGGPSWQSYDLSKFLPVHPGGATIIAKWAGKDGTRSFGAIHPTTIVEQLDPSAFVGDLDESTRPASEVAAEQKEDEAVIVPSIETCINAFDFEAVARKRIPKEALDYLNSAADDEITHRENTNVYHRVWFKPAIMVNVTKVDPRVQMLGADASFPAYISSVALGKLYHPDGECALAIAAQKVGIPFAVPVMGSCTFKEIQEAASPTRWLQLYVNPDRAKCRQTIEEAERSGMQGLLLTVDSPVFGKRERDRRNKVTVTAANQKDGSSQGAGVASALQRYVDSSLSWDDIPWFRSVTNMKLVLKGVQRAEDAQRAVDYGLDGIVVSNHGGRQLDFARPSLEALKEITDYLRAEGLQNRIEVFVDGGIRRGTDIFKALALGAKGVGLGRSAMYALGAYGAEGVERYLEILREEFETCMRLMGCTTLAEIRPSMVVTDTISLHMTEAPQRTLPAGLYTPLMSNL
jgi:L-lactate dehydrogenase (cytochrome)